MLYKEGGSAQQVADELGVSINIIYDSLQRLQVARRSPRESNRIRYESQPLSYRIKEQLTPEEEKLRLAAVMLYWAEGYKIGSVIDFANADPAMALLFRKFLREICQVDERRIRGHIYCYEGQDVEALSRFWSAATGIPRDQFTKPYVKKAAAHGRRGPRMLNGLVHVRYCDKKLLQQMLRWIEEYQLDLTKLRRW